MIHFLVLWFFSGVNNNHVAENNPFFFLRIDIARTIVFTFVTM